VSKIGGSVKMTLILPIRVPVGQKIQNVTKIEESNIVLTSKTCRLIVIFGDYNDSVKSS
jgi:hypothetical protein